MRSFLLLSTGQRLEHVTHSLVYYPLVCVAFPLALATRLIMRRLHVLLFFIALGSNALAQTSEIQAPPPYIDPPEEPPASPYFDSVWAKVLPHVTTECKTCPYALCPNKDFYLGQFMFRATCWATGQKINATRLDNWAASLWFYADKTIQYMAKERGRLLRH
jgi:hypothetical protein